MRGLRDLDRILRGGVTNPTALSRGGPVLPLGPLARVIILLAAGYGACMGSFGLFGRPEPEVRFLLADAVKVPLLLLLTLAVTFPSLYVFTALVGSRLGAADLARLATAAVGVTVAVLAGFGPVVAFFSVTGTSYPFTLLLNVAVFAVAGGFGVAFMVGALKAMSAPPVPDQPPPDVPPGPPARPGWGPETNVRVVVRAWLVVFALVGVQMSWVLRPFIGALGAPFAWFRPREGSFFEAVVRAARALVG